MKDGLLCNPWDSVTEDLIPLKESCVDVQITRIKQVFQMGSSVLKCCPPTFSK